MRWLFCVKAFTQACLRGTTKAQKSQGRNSGRGVSLVSLPPQSSQAKRILSHKLTRFLIEQPSLTSFIDMNHWQHKRVVSFFSGTTAHAQT
jgi:hypothetical protein